MDLGLKDRTAVVTGASRGIGLAIVRALAEAGAQVVAGARGSSAELDELVRTGPVQSLAVDLTAPDGPETQTQSRSISGNLLRTQEIIPPSPLVGE